MPSANFNRSSMLLLVLFFFSHSLVAVCTKTTTATPQACVSSKGASAYPVIDAEYYLPIADGVLKVGGDVCINMNEQSISTDELFYYDKAQTVEIKSGLIYTDTQQQISADTASIDLEKKSAQLTGASYEIKQTQANGTADLILTQDAISHLKNLTYSTCPEDNPQWYIKAKTAQLNQQTQKGVFRNTTLNFKGVPILYLPYMKLPLNNQRESGFLIPEFSSSNTNGTEFAIPYYINIAANMDATLTPRYFSERGVMLDTEFRYLGQNFQGKIVADYMPSDKQDNENRHFLQFNHSHRWNNQWSFNTNLSNVSDNRYFEDFGNSINATSQSFLYSYLFINGFSDNWRLKASINDFQILSDSITLNSQPYQSLPRVDFSWFNNAYTSSLNYGFDSSWSNLYRQDSITVARLDVAPYIEKTWQNSYSRFTPKLAYRLTHWNYADTEFSTIDTLKDSRNLPILSLDYLLSFEKQFADGSLNTLEPRLFYLNVPFEGQQDIPLFDTHELTFGSALLYQTNTFSGADRQSDANQLSLGLTQRHFDQQGSEQWNLTLGQINYFENRRVQLDDTIETRSTSPIISEFNYFYRNWKASMSVHWDTQIDKSERALLKFQRKGNNNSVFNFAYRFRRGKIEQLDSSIVLPIGVNNRVIARWDYSIEDRTTLEAIVGFEHKNCCWASRLVSRRYVINEQGNVNNGIFFELQFEGLGALGKNPRRQLKQSILGYTEEF